MIARYVREVAAMGAPVDLLLARSGIPGELLGHAALAVPLKSAFRFGDLACRTLGTEHLGLRVALATSLDDLGPYGRWLGGALTVHDHLRRGIFLYNRLITGQRFWLSNHGNELRLNLSTDWEPGIGPYQSQIESLAITIARLRAAAGPDWSPREVSLAWRSGEDLPDVDLFAGSRVLRETGETYLTIPRTLLGLSFPGNGGEMPASDLDALAGRPMPEDLGGLVQLQIEALLSDRAAHVDTVAETLAMSRRGLQRGLAEQGLSYSQMLNEVRVRRAADSLTAGDKPIAEIAYDLGYTDASNFTRAFRRQTGVSPHAFRDRARGR